MVKYNLGFYKKNDTKIIDLSNVLNLKELDDLDEFTSSFRNENELKIYLVKKGVLDTDYILKDISVVYKYDNGYKKIKVLYNSDRKYLDEQYLKHKLMSLANDLVFLEKLANRYDVRTRFNLQGTNVASIRQFLIFARSYKDVEVTQPVIAALADLFIKAIWTINKKTGEVKINYRGLRDLAMFISKYENKIKSKEEINTQLQDLSEQITFGDITNKPQIEEQEEIVDFDFIYPLDNQLYTQDGSLFFPPNSEEERIYKIQLEKQLEKNMDIEDHPHHRR